MTDLTCPKCLKETPHVSLEYVAQYVQTKHGPRMSKSRVQRVGECVRCTTCRLIYISTEGKEASNG